MIVTAASRERVAHPTYRGRRADPLRDHGRPGPRPVVEVPGRRFDFGNPHDVSVLASGGVYVPGDAVLPDGVLLTEGTDLREAVSVPDGSLFDTGAVPVDGTAVVEKARPATDAPGRLSVLRQSGVLLPPGSTRTEH